MDIIEHASRAAQTAAITDQLAAALRARLAGSGSASLAVAGGTTPGPVFDALAQVDLDWARVCILPTDERWVPEDHARSNARLIRERLMQGRAQAARFVSLYEPGGSVDEGLAAVRERVGDHVPLTAVLLGMGTDMHTASLFPGGAQLADALGGAHSVYAMDAPGADEPRITVSAGALNSATCRVLMITGPDKRDAARASIGVDPMEAPIAAVTDGSVAHWAE